MSTYYVRIRGSVHGPISELNLRRMVKRGLVTPSTEVSTDQQTWVRARDIPGLFDSRATRGGESSAIGNAHENTAGAQAVSVAGKEWYYTLHGASHGPVPENQILALIAQGTLGPDDLVWREGFQDWQPISSTELARHIPQATTVQPHPTSLGTPVGTSASVPAMRWVLPGEEILREVPLHPLTFTGPFLFQVILTVVLLMGASATDETMARTATVIAVVVTWAFFAAWSLLIYLTSTCFITSLRVVGRTGIFARKWVSVHYAHASGVVIRQGLLGQLLNYGTLGVVAAGFPVAAFYGRAGVEEAATLISHHIAQAHAGQNG